jgi:sarcosine oxidase
MLARMAHIAIVGAGVFGAWAAHHLLSAGHHLTLIDAYGPAHSRSSSGDESRIIRCGYGPDEIYSRWARTSLADWRDLSRRASRPDAPLFHACGVLWLAGDDAYTRATYRTLSAGGYSVERLGSDDLRARFPHIASDDLSVGLFEPECGVLMARRAVQSLVAELESRGVTYLRRHVTSTDVGEIGADAYVFACGPWLPKVFPDLLADRIRPTRQAVVYFGTPAGDVRLGPAYTPAWVDFAAGIYGVPELEQRGIKVGLDRHGPPFDPDASDRVADAESIATARAWLARRMPVMSGAPVVETRVCQYENTDTGDFLIDRHPSLENVWIAGGGSGHGFKHGPAVGRYVAGLIDGSAAIEPRFSIAARGTAAQRSVY